MKQLISFLLLACSLSLAQTAVISPVNPPVYQGQTQTFACASGCGSGGVWSVSGAGSINSSTGVYMAPATVTAQQTLGGYQLMPNNHIFNTRIDSLPLRADSDIMIQSILQSHPTTKLSYGLGFVINWANNSTPTQAETFLYTAPNNGNYMRPTFPGERWQNGYYGELAGRTGDHHTTNFNTDTGQIEDKYWAADAIGHPVTLESGIKYTQSQYALPPTNAPATVAGGEFLAPLLLRVSETNNACAQGGSINHALLMTLASYTYGKTMVWPATAPGYQCTAGAQLAITNIAVTSNVATITVNNTLSSGATVIIGGVSHSVLIGSWVLTAATSTYVQFAITTADIASTPDTGLLATNACQNKYSVRYRLKSSFDQSGYSACQQVLINQLKNYGLFFTDGGTNLQAEGEWGAYSPTVSQAIATLSGQIPAADFEVVDESGLEISATSGETNLNQETVCYTPTGGTAGCTDVVLQGVAVNLPQESLYIMAGTPAQQLTALVHDGASNSVTWSMSPSLGTLTSGGLYTAPSSITGAAQSTTITATSTVNSAVTAVMTVWVFPASGFFGMISPTRVTTSGTITGYTYTDASGHVWGANWQYGVNGLTLDIGAEGQMCYQAYCTHSAWLAAGQPFWQVLSSGFSGDPGDLAGGDINTSFLLPAGKYSVTYNYAAFAASGVRSFNFIGQGALLNGTPIDPTAAVGQFYPYTYSVPLTVGSNNQLSFDIWSSGAGTSTQSADISSMSIIPLYSGPLMQGSFTGVFQ